MKRIVILGSTGSIGTQALDVVRKHPSELKVVGLSTHGNVELLRKQVEEFRPEVVCVTDERKKITDTKCKTLKGMEGLIELASLPSADMVAVAVVGVSGIAPTITAIKAKKEVALATKEVMVMAGEIVLGEARKNAVSIIPIDSEMSAVFQSLRAGERSEVKRLILTMGKGKIAKMSEEEFGKVSIEDVFGGGHWKMGDKITVDSATCVNKAFEVIEARWFFDIPGEKISVTVHPEYICHSMVEFVDGSVVGEFGTSDMKRYIQHALLYPRRLENDLGMDMADSASSPLVDSARASTELSRMSSPLVGKTISFEEPPFKRFPLLSVGYRVLDLGGTAGAVFHGADEVAVEAFMSKKISFQNISEVVLSVLEKEKIIKNPNLEQIFGAEEKARETAWDMIRRIQ